MKGFNYNGDFKETRRLICKEVKVYAKENDFKVSIRTNSGTSTTSLTVTLKVLSSGLTKETIANYKRDIKKIMESYNRDDSDAMTDYFDSFFYGFVEIDYLSEYA